MQPEYVTDQERADQTRQSRCNVWRQARAGLIPPPVKLSANCTRWLRHELQTVDAARIAGADDAEVRALVQRLVADRQRKVAA